MKNIRLRCRASKYIFSKTEIRYINQKSKNTAKKNFKVSRYLNTIQTTYFYKFGNKDLKCNIKLNKYKVKKYSII